MAEQSTGVPQGQPDLKAEELAERGRASYREGDLESALTNLHQAYGLHKDEGNRKRKAFEALRNYAYHREALAMSWGAARASKLGDTDDGPV